MKNTGKYLDARDAAFFAGLAMIGIGAWLVYEPAGLIAPGVVLVFKTAVWGRG